MTRGLYFFSPLLQCPKVRGGSATSELKSCSPEPFIHRRFCYAVPVWGHACSTLSGSRPPEIRIREGGGSVQVDTHTIDIGKIRQRETRDVAFRLYNASQNDLSLESVHTSCSCTNWHLDKRKLKSNETAELSVTFSSGQGRNRLGATLRVFYKNLETEESGNVFLNLIADIQPDYSILPPFLDFTEATETVQYITLAPRFDEDIRILDTHCTRNYYEVGIVKSEPTESIVGVTFLPEKKLSGEKQAILELKTSSSRQPSYPISLNCDP